MWFNLCAAASGSAMVMASRGNRLGIDLRDTIARKMTAEQIAEAQRSPGSGSRRRIQPQCLDHICLKSELSCSGCALFGGERRTATELSRVARRYFHGQNSGRFRGYLAMPDNGSSPANQRTKVLGAAAVVGQVRSAAPVPRRCPRPPGALTTWGGDRIFRGGGYFNFASSFPARNASPSAKRLKKE
jgi:hypothetical protein